MNGFCMRSVGLVLFWALAVSTAWGQVSDYEVAEKFKQSVRDLETRMATETDPGRLEAIRRQVGELKSRYASHEALLDDALYPESFSSVFNRLASDGASRQQAAVERSHLIEREQKLVVRQKELVNEVAVKTRENEKLRQELNRVAADLARSSRESDALRDQIRSLRTQLTAGQGVIDSLKAENEKDRQTIERINRLVETLNANLASRDRMLAELKDKLKARDDAVAALGKKLLEGFGKPGISPAETRELAVGVDESDYFGMVLATVDENVRFVESTFLSPGDLEFARAENGDFSKMWEAVGPRLAIAYPADGAAEEDLGRIESAIKRWGDAIDKAAWRNLQTVFTRQGFGIGPFNSGTELRDRLVGFMQEEKKAYGRQNFDRFKQEVWDAEVKPQWIPYLEAGGKFDASLLADTEAALTDWGKRSYTLYWIIGLALLLAVSVAVLLIRRKQAFSNGPPPPAAACPG